MAALQGTPHMLRHACDMHLQISRAPQHKEHGALYRAVAGTFQGFLAAMTRGCLEMVTDVVMSVIICSYSSH